MGEISRESRRTCDWGRARGAYLAAPPHPPAGRLLAEEAVTPAWDGALLPFHLADPPLPDLVCHRALLSAVGGGERAPRAAGLGELGGVDLRPRARRDEIERDADDVARCFALERTLYESGFEQAFSGEVAG